MCNSLFNLWDTAGLFVKTITVHTYTMFIMSQSRTQVRVKLSGYDAWARTRPVSSVPCGAGPRQVATPVVSRVTRSMV